jgi:putative flavoprotein involved in K+ transport
LRANSVIVATGRFQKPKILPFADGFPNSIFQIHSSEFRNEALLPDGAVLVVGSAQSGAQIAEELYQAGRQVYLSVGSAGRAPRRYRGRDTVAWLEQIGYTSRTVDMLPSPKAKFGGSLQASGKNGGHTLNLHQFARDGVVLLGHLTGIQDGSISIAPDLNESLAKSDKVAEDLKGAVDAYILQHGLDVPAEPDSGDVLTDGYQDEVLTELDLQAAGISTVIWATGYTFNFDWVRLPVVDGDGFPIQKRGVTHYPGLYFLGLPWLHTVKSGLLLGVGADAEHVVSHLIASA